MATTVLCKSISMKIIDINQKKEIKNEHKQRDRKKSAGCEDNPCSVRYNRKLWFAGNEKAAYPSGWRNPNPAGCRRKDTLC
jgi:hypothetical protein